MELSGLSTTSRSPYTTVRIRRDVASILRTIALAERVAISDLAQAALFAWAQQYRPGYGATLTKDDASKLVALLEQQEAPAAAAAPKKVRKTTKRR